ncbi:MAG: hypothetical protein OER56_01590 [Hyphomicrobiales bacterium]|nr:hypothetical protein [Hyphomicrobiales bacterium]
MADPTGWEIAGQFANMMTAGAAAFAALCAWRGLSSWRQELVGRRKALLAEEVLSGFYQASDSFKAIRSPGSFPQSEGKNRERSDRETAAQSLALDAHYVPIARIEKHSELFGNLTAKRYSMKALFGDQVDAPFDTINQVLHEIQFAAAMMMREAKRGERATASAERWEKWEATIWYGGEDRDEIAESVEAAVQQIEHICGPFLEARK